APGARPRSSARWASATCSTWKAGSWRGRRRWIRRFRSTDSSGGPFAAVGTDAAPTRSGATGVHSEAAAGVQPGLLFGTADAAQGAVAVREAAEAFDHVQVRLGVAQVALVAQGLEQRHRATLVGQRLGVFERQVDEGAQVFG